MDDLLIFNSTIFFLFEQRKRAEDGEILSESDSENEGGPKKKRGRKKEKYSDSEPEYDSEGNVIEKKKKRGR